MNKKQYTRELSLSSTQRRNGNNSKKEVMKIQEWLCLQGESHRSWGTITAIDGDFGPATERAVKNFQAHKGLSRTGIVTSNVFKKLSEPLKNAFEGVQRRSHLRETVLAVANEHLREDSRELVVGGQNNCGPWVRSYMLGKDGESYYWCAGFVSLVMDQAFAMHGKNVNSMLKYTMSCDNIAAQAKNHTSFIKAETYRRNPSVIKPGDIFLSRKNSRDWTHTGIILQVRGSSFITIEGNTNESGGRNGYGVLKRVRNFNRGTYDVFSVQKWMGTEDQPLRVLPTLRHRSRGKSVYFLEEELVKTGYREVVVSNYFGLSTDKAVKKFQRKNRLVVDGIVGPQTWRILLSR